MNHQRLDIFQHCKDSKGYLPENIVIGILTSGYFIDTVLSEPGFFPILRMIDAACSSGNLELAKLFYGLSGMFGINDLRYAAVNGHLGIVKFLHENQIEGCADEPINSATSNDHLEIVMFLHYNRTGDT